MTFHPDQNLPGCMMPDGEDCCVGYAAICEDWHKQRREIDRLQDAKRAALKLDDERAKEANELRHDRDKWHRVAMEAGAVTCVDGSHIFPLKQGK